MPKTFREILEKGIERGTARSSFIDRMEKKAPRRLPKRVGRKPNRGTLFAIRNKRLTIAESALRKVQVIITYTKTTTGETNKYICYPMSYRTRMLKVGRRKMLYVWDMEDRHTKSFAIKSIRNVVLTDRKFRPKYPIEIGR